MTIFERRQRLLMLLQQQPGIRVPELAELVGVSEGTIRNDLNALAEVGQLTRVRGGAVLTERLLLHSASFAARARVNEAAKQCIARWAAGLVADGDAILLDASTTVYQIAQCLQARRDLTVVTNGIEVGRRLAQNPTNTVILLGGALRPDGTAVTGPLSEGFLTDLHVKTAFVSCTGFTLEAGLTEADIHEAPLKRKMITAAASVVALIDSSKFGKVDLTPFARADQISYLCTDGALAPHWIATLRKTCRALAVCDEKIVSTFTPCSEDQVPYPDQDPTNRVGR